MGVRLELGEAVDKISGDSRAVQLELALPQALPYISVCQCCCKDFVMGAETDRSDALLLPGTANTHLGISQDTGADQLQGGTKPRYTL